VPEAEKVRLEVAFEGGQGVTVLVAVATADELDHALAKADNGAVSFDADDGRYTLAVRKIVFVKRHARESRVGFGS
jgi:hypothetical protein